MKRRPHEWLLLVFALTIAIVLIVAEAIVFRPFWRWYVG